MGVSNEVMIQMLTKYIELCTPDPGIFDFGDNELKEISYCRWAAEEIRTRIMDHFQTQHWTDICDAFILKMEAYRRMAINGEIAHLFEVAQNAVQSFYDM